MKMFIAAGTIVLALSGAATYGGTPETALWAATQPQAVQSAEVRGYALTGERRQYRPSMATRDLRKDVRGGRANQY